MNLLTTYQNLSLLYESATSLVYRGTRLVDQQAIILKVLKEEYPSPDELTRYRQEYEITNFLKSEGVIKAYHLAKYQHSLVIELEDFGGESLKILLTQQTFSIETLLKIAVRIAGTLAEIHSANVIHKDINPSNIVFNPQTQQLKLIDFGISSQLPRETPILKNPYQLEGTLAYISPEQTGRMNRIIDYRTDFYAFGATLYELFTRQLPFTEEDPLALVYCHLAKTPIPPHQLNTNIPEVLSDIILKLMEKMAENRYQNAWGLQQDLARCVQDWQENKTIKKFIIGQQDITDKFHIPQKLYGRNKEITQLQNTFAHVCEGKTELLLVSGFSGVGKSFLINEVYKPLTEKQGYFISGKYDQYQRNIPYFALTQAFNEFCNYLLTENSEKLAYWKQQILTAVKNNGQVLIEIIPRLELVIGSQPAVSAVGAQEAQYRFNLVFQEFFRIISQANHPLVLFIDDLQWADSASLQLLKTMMNDNTRYYSLIIGAYRENEVNKTHPFIMMLTDIKQTTITHLSLANLTYVDINDFIVDALLCDMQDTHPLTELVYQKTQGNAFFTTAFLKTLHDEKLISFNTKQRYWEWNLSQIQAKNLTDNVLILMASKISKFPLLTQLVLQLAACIGNQFDLYTLSLINDLSAFSTLKQLWVAICEGLIIPLDTNYKLVQDISDVTANNLIASNTHFKFQHDKVQQAAYSLIPSADGMAIHLRIGRLLFANTTPKEQDDKLFDIVNQWNAGKTLITEPAEQIQLAELNCLAGEKAKASAAYLPALSYFQTGLTLLGEQCWQTHYSLTLRLSEQAAESAYLNTDFVQLQILTEQVLKQVTTLLDKVKIYHVMIQAYIAKNQPYQAVETALTILQLLDVHFPVKPKAWHIKASLWHTRWLLRGRAVETFTHHFQMTDPRHLAIMRILSSVSFASYYIKPDLFVLISLKLVQLSIKYGNTASSAIAYASCGLVLCYVTGEIELGYQFGKLALKILDQFPQNEFKAKTLFMFNNFIRFWKEHIKETLVPFQETYHLGLELGDLESGALSVFLYVCHAYCSGGRELNHLEKESAEYAKIIQQLKQDITLHRHAIYHQAILNLLGRTADPCLLSGDSFDEATALPLHQLNNNKTILFRFYSTKLMLCYWFENYTEALHCATLTTQYLEAGKALFIVPIFIFYDSLTQLQYFANSSPINKQVILRNIRLNQKKLKHWATHAPMNYLHKWWLVEAERWRVLGHDKECRAAYEQAISLAQTHEYWHEEALAHELAGKFYLARENIQLARFYLHGAHYGWMRWGALAKVRHLENRYPQFLSAKQHNTSNNILFTNITSNSEVSNTNSQKLDLLSVLKASQAMATEIVLPHLLTHLMKIVLENAGAQRGVLILDKQGQWFIEAEGKINPLKINVLQSTPLVLNHNTELPISIIHYVLRTQETVDLQNAAYEGQFTTDTYVTAHKAKSILCLPLINKGKLGGLLYLENQLTAGVFTLERSQVLSLLTAQLLISIDNARLYQSLRESEERFRVIAETTPIAFLLTRPVDGFILYANPQASLTFGIPNEDFVHSYTTMLYSNPSERTHILSQFSQMGSVRDYEVRMKRGDGQLIWVSLFVAPILFEQQQVLLSTYYDITDRKRMEQERLLLVQEREAKNTALRLNKEIQAQKEELSSTLARLQATQCQLIEAEKMAALGNLVAGVAHEINTPVGISITAASQLELNTEELQQQCEQNKLKRADLNNYLDNTVQISQLLLVNLHRTAELVNRFKQIAVEQSSEQQHTFYLKAHLNNILTSLQPYFHHTAHQVHIHCDDKLRIVSYSGILTQVFTHLITNSLTHGFHDITEGTIDITAQLDATHLTILYKDNGNGIPMVVQTHLFEPFVTTDRQHGKSGLGLHIVYNLVVHHLKGQIRYLHTTEQGTQFSLVIPCLADNF
ncbi:AAA family ATPase [Beggiatoa leptomitoformis]|uniref:histidine kinase n=1 Tax=Beggiatoa leptomitoformis TaxID=288004 RepID=A0A2N9YE44_9GAMM|nr:AAA family ATPase [Beggiatoa leptomitoformis]AUI68655.1 AAA family ATPase [Beggiatoa leptomitoformis]QGX03819.1 AAA family ATPase [Beggiatoa leptomitoformis]